MIFRNIIRLILLLIVLVIIADAEEIAPRDPEALMHLIEDCVYHGDPVVTVEKLTLFLGKPSGVSVPTVSSETYFQKEKHFRIKQFYADVLREVGLFILENPRAFPQGLPSLVTLQHRERLAPLFEALTPYPHLNAPLQQTLGPLNPLITADWIEAARQADAWQWIHTLRGLRGEMQMMLSEYEKAGDDTSIHKLGELLGIYPELSQSIIPESCTTRTLALLFGAALSDGNLELDEIFPVIIKLDEWEKSRPGLRQQVAEMTARQVAIPWCDVVKLFRAGQREEAVRLLYTLPTVYLEVLPRYAGKIDMVQRYEEEDVRLRARLLQILLSSQDCPDEALPALARTMPINLLMGTVKVMLRYDNNDPEELWRGTLLLSELVNRQDRPENLRDALRFHQSDIQRVKDLFSQAKQEDRADAYSKAMERIAD
jgi:hypothetical protein